MAGHFGPSAPPTPPASVYSPVSPTSDLPPALLLSALGLGGGALLADRRGSPIRDRTRGAIKGLLTLLGGYGGSVAGNALMADNGLTVENRSPLLDLGAIGGGAFAGHSAGRALSSLMGLEGKKRREEDKEASVQLALEKQAASPVIEALLAAKVESDRRNYSQKHRILRGLLQQYPEQFKVDSNQNGIVGLTHQSGFKIHAPVYVLPHVSGPALPLATPAA